MECERVGRGVSAGTCGGVCDAMERCGGGGAAKNVAPLSGGPLLTLERELVSAEIGLCLAVDLIHEILCNLLLFSVVHLDFISRQLIK